MGGWWRGFGLLIRFGVWGDFRGLVRHARFYGAAGGAAAWVDGTRFAFPP
jgi:hypothetical protein